MRSGAANAKVPAVRVCIKKLLETVLSRDVELPNSDSRFTGCIESVLAFSDCIFNIDFGRISGFYSSVTHKRLGLFTYVAVKSRPYFGTCLATLKSAMKTYLSVVIRMLLGLMSRWQIRS